MLPLSDDPFLYILCRDDVIVVMKGVPNMLSIWLSSHATETLPQIPENLANVVRL